MTDGSREDRLLDLIYDAAADPELWTEVMERVAPLVGGEHSVMSRLDIVDGTGSAKVSGVDAQVLDSYFSHFFKVNPLQLVSDPQTYTRGWRPKIVIDEEWMERGAFEASEYYNDFLRPISAEWSLMVRLGLRGSEVAAISIARSLRRGRFEPDEIALAGRLQSHLVRAYALSERLATLQGLNSNLASVLDQSPFAMLLLSGEGRILHANARGDRLLAAGDLLCAVGGRLTGVSPYVEQRIGGLIADAAAAGWERRTAGAVSLRSPKRPFPLSVTASPLRLERTTVFAGGRAVLVCVSDPSTASAQPPAEALAALFSLTAAEARLAADLREGLSLKAAAARRGVSVNTSRVQLSSLFAKTGTHRQSELMRLLMAHGGLETGWRGAF